jgi:hypothetical protein
MVSGSAIRTSSSPAGENGGQEGDPSLAHYRHVDAADRWRLLRWSHVEGVQARVAADVNRPGGGEREAGQAIEQRLRPFVLA